jgi:D-lactate dehydrogenase
MRMTIYNTKPYEQRLFEETNQNYKHDLIFLDARLNPKTAILANGSPAICAFVNDDLGAEVLQILAAGGTRLIALRSAGFNHVDLQAAAKLDLTVVRVPAYSPHAVAEHTVGLMLALNRQIHRANRRVRDGNFALSGLMGFDFHGRTAGLVGTGKIGEVVAKILKGFGIKLLAYDLHPNQVCLDLGVQYVDFEDLLARSDIVSLHCPLTPETHHLIDEQAVKQMKERVMLINTSRGALVDTRAVIKGLKAGQIGYLGLDVYEEEGDLFFEDLSDYVIQDDVFSRLLTFPNVLITAHQGFFTEEALESIITITLENVNAFEAGTEIVNALSLH